MELKIVTAWVALIFFNNRALSFLLGGGGEFFFFFEGLYPKKFENEFIKYDSCYEPLNHEDYLNRRMYAIVVVKKKWENLGGITMLSKESSGDWKNTLTEKSVDSLCELPFRTPFFNDRFSGSKRVDKATCSLDKGTYYLRNYSLEDDIRNYTSIFTYGHYNYTITLLADIEGKKTKIATASLLMWSKDAKRKNVEPKPKKWPKCDKYE